MLLHFADGFRQCFEQQRNLFLTDDQGRREQITLLKKTLAETIREVE